MGCFFKRQKSITIASANQSILDSSKRKPNKIWADQAGEFYDSLIKK